MRTRLGVEHGVGRQGADDVEAFFANMLDCGYEQVDFFAAHIAAFAGMRVETGNRQTRIGDTEIALQPFGCGAQTLTDKPGFQLTCNRCQRNMCGHRHHT
jgi:hypothetical protein